MLPTTSNGFSLVGINGNAFSIMGYVQKAMKQLGKTQQEIKSFIDEAMSDDYNHLVRVSQDQLAILNAELELIGQEDSNS